jgi:hypothetical protein
MYEYTVTYGSSDGDSSDTEEHVYTRSPGRQVDSYGLFLINHTSGTQIVRNGDAEVTWDPYFWSCFKTATGNRNRENPDWEAILGSDIDRVDAGVKACFEPIATLAMEQASITISDIQLDVNRWAIHDRAYGKGEGLVRLLNAPQSEWYHAAEGQPEGVMAHHRALAPQFVDATRRRNLMSESLITTTDLVHMLSAAQWVSDPNGTYSNRVPAQLYPSLVATIQQKSPGNPSNAEVASLSRLSVANFTWFCEAWDELTTREYHTGRSSKVVRASAYARVSDRGKRLLREHATMRHLLDIYSAKLESSIFDAEWRELEYETVSGALPYTDYPENYRIGVHVSHHGMLRARSDADTMVVNRALSAELVARGL